MSPKSEIEAFADLENTLSQLEDPKARNRILKWAWDKYSTEQLPKTDKIDEREKPARKKRKSTSKSRQSPSIVKELDLSPKGKKSFQDFVEEKQPSSNSEKCTVAVYYLHHELGIENITINQVFTCYRDVKKWKPGDVYDYLAKTASNKGWLDTSNMEDISITPQGEHFVETQLPQKIIGK